MWFYTASSATRHWRTTYLSRWSFRGIICRSNGTTCVYNPPSRRRLSCPNELHKQYLVVSMFFVGYQCSIARCLAGYTNTFQGQRPQSSKFQQKGVARIYIACVRGGHVHILDVFFVPRTRTLPGRALTGKMIRSKQLVCACRPCFVCTRFNTCTQKYSSRSMLIGSLEMPAVTTGSRSLSHPPSKADRYPETPIQKRVKIG